MNSVVIVGAGWLGKALAIHLNKKGFGVSTTNRTSKYTIEFDALGIENFILDLDNPNTFNKDFFQTETLLFTAAYKNAENFRKFLDFLTKETIVKNILFISSTSVYPDSETKITEQTTRRRTILTEMEDVLIASDFNSIILRFSGLIGYNRHPKNYINRSVPMASPNGVVNWVHRDDCILIIEKLLSQAFQSDIYNVCATSHPLRKNIYTKLALHFKMDLPVFEEQNSNKIKYISSQKIKSKLGYSFKYDDFDFLFDKLLF